MTATNVHGGLEGAAQHQLGLTDIINEYENFGNCSLRIKKVWFTYLFALTCYDIKFFSILKKYSILLSSNCCKITDAIFT